MATVIDLAGCPHAELVQYVAGISIRSRLALSTRCIESALAHLGISDARVNELVETLWAGVEATQLDAWDREISELEPESVDDFASVPETGDYEYLSLDDAETRSGDRDPEPRRGPLRTLVFALFQNAIEVGVGNLYGGTGSDSPHTLWPCVNVLAMMRRNDFRVPDAAPFSASPFAEAGGWGKPRPRTDWI